VSSISLGISQPSSRIKPTGSALSRAGQRRQSKRIYSEGLLGISCLLRITTRSPLYRFAIPFTLATTLGLAAVALRGDPDMQVLSPADVSAGLPASAAASALLGQSGATTMLILLFLAVTSPYHYL
jgi:hypothetical protein